MPPWACGSQPFSAESSPGGLLPAVTTFQDRGRQCLCLVPTVGTWTVVVWGGKGGCCRRTCMVGLSQGQRGAPRAMTVLQQGDYRKRGESSHCRTHWQVRGHFSSKGPHPSPGVPRWRHTGEGKKKQLVSNPRSDCSSSCDLQVSRSLRLDFLGTKRAETPRFSG